MVLTHSPVGMRNRLGEKSMEWRVIILKVQPDQCNVFYVETDWWLWLYWEEHHIQIILRMNSAVCCFLNKNQTAISNNSKSKASIRRILSFVDRWFSWDLNFFAVSIEILSSAVNVLTLSSNDRHKGIQSFEKNLNLHI